MKWRIFFLCAVVLAISAVPTKAQTRIIVRTTLGSQVLSQFCLLQGCTLIQGLDGDLDQLFVIVAPDLVSPATLLTAVEAIPGVVDAELDQLVSLTAGLNTVTTVPSGLTDTTPVSYYGSVVWNGYVVQPASGIVQLPQAQSTYQFFGSGIIADIDTGVDPNHPALKPVLLLGYDFTRNQPGGSEMTDFTGPAPTSTGTQPVQVNQYTAAMLDSPTASLLFGNSQYAAFGHGTMVMGVLHLVAPQAQLLPLKAFGSNGTANLSDILRAIYFATQNNANVINMSFDMTTPSAELGTALTYATASNVICAASAGNEGQETAVYPASLNASVMGIASTNDLNTRSSFSNYGSADVWVAAPGEGIITTYPFSTYSAGWGTSFSSPFVAGTAALLLNSQGSLNQVGAAAAIANAQALTSDLNHGLLDVSLALQSLTGSGLFPKIALGATRLSFANQSVGTQSVPQTLTITNSGTALLTISSIALTAPNQADFAIQSNNCGSSLSAGTSCSIGLQFVPNAVGVLSAALTILDNAPGSPHSVVLTGLGLGSVSSLSAANLSFQGQLVTTESASQTITLTNIGNSLMNLTSIALAGPNSSDFSLVNQCGMTLAAGASCTFSLKFAPSATGPRTASLSIVDDATSGPNLIPMTGTGTDFSLSLATGSSSVITINPGQTGTMNLQATPISGFNGPITLTCSGAPQYSACLVTPSSITLNGASAANVRVSITTTGTAGAATLPFTTCWPHTSPILRLLLVLCLPALALFGLRNVKPALGRRPISATICLALAFCGGCGSANSSSDTISPTPAGMYNLMVTGVSNGVSHSQTVTLTVN
jgi:hypothetical protein